MPAADCPCASYRKTEELRGRITSALGGEDAAGFISDPEEVVVSPRSPRTGTKRVPKSVRGSSRKRVKAQARRLQAGS